MPDHPLLKQWLLDPAVVGIPFIQELGGLHALELVADLIDAKGWWQHGFPPSSFPKYVAHLAAPMERPQPGFVRILYFPTRPADIPAFLALISFVILFARLNYYHGPVAWLNFPLGLLDEAHIGTMRSVMVELDRLVLRPQQMGPSLAFEGDDATDAVLFIGARPPKAWELMSGSVFATEWGLPLICIPSRTLSEVTLDRVPWLEQGSI